MPRIPAQLLMHVGMQGRDLQGRFMSNNTGIRVRFTDISLRSLRRTAEVWKGEKNEELRQIAEKYRELIYDAAYELCPVDTGALRQSIRVIVDDLIVIASAEIHYAMFVELGTRLMDAQPFLYPAFERYAHPMYRELQAVFRKRSSNRRPTRRR